MPVMAASALLRLSGSAALLLLSSCAAAAADPSSAGWDNPPPTAAGATTRHSALGLFAQPAQPAAGNGSAADQTNSGLVPTIGNVAKSPKNPLFIQDKPWEPRLDNGYPNVVFDPDSAARGDGPWRLWYGGIGPGGQHSHRRDCNSAAAPSSFSRCFNRDEAGVSAK